MDRGRLAGWDGRWAAGWRAWPVGRGRLGGMDRGWLAGMGRGWAGWHGPWAAGPRGPPGPRWPGGPGHYARTHDRGAVIAAGRACHPGDAQRAARARLRHRPAHR